MTNLKLKYSYMLPLSIYWILFSCVVAGRRIWCLWRNDDKFGRL